MSDHLQTTAAMGFIKSMLVGFNIAFWVSLVIVVLSSTLPLSSLSLSLTFLYPTQPHSCNKDIQLPLRRCLMKGNPVTDLFAAPPA